MEERRRNIREINHDRYVKKTNTKERKKRLFIRRTLAAVTFAVIVFVFIFILLMTPIFDVRTIGVNGNSIVPIAQIDACLGDLVGQNLTRISKADVMKRFSNNPYIKDCEISKKYIPATLYVDVIENIPAAYININAQLLVLDSKLNVIDDSNSVPVTSVPQILGIDSGKYKIGKPLQSENTEKISIAQTILSAAEDTNILGSITRIDIGNTLDITFTYEDRLTAHCGSSLELDRKVRMFKEAVTNASMNPDAAGIVNLSEPGKATYTPEGSVPEFFETEQEEDTQEDDEKETQ